METFRHQRSPGSDRFLGLFSPAPAASGGGGVAGDELHEDEVFWTTPAPDPPTERSRSTKPSPATASRVPNPSPATAAFGGAGGRGAVLRLFPDRSFGILAALAEHDRKRAAVTASSSAPFVHRKATFAAAPYASAPSAPASALASASTSPSSSAWAIPAVPKPKSEFSRSATAGSKIYQQSAPVKVPVRPTRPRKGSGALDVVDDDDEGYRGEAGMLPPHEIVARAWGDGTPMMTSSVLEGVGRTLKGRDLRRVRNAVLQQTGFLDKV